MFSIRTVSSKYVSSVKRCFSTSFPLNTRKVAVVLSGSGVYDGSEIHEACAILVHLTKCKAEPLIYAPDVKQMHVIDHRKGEPITTESRNVLVESARIARGNIKSLAELSVASHDAIVFPGGFGVAKNLSTFAVDGVNCEVIPEVEQVIKAFHAAKKPIALCCISPILAARVLGTVEITLGQEKDDGSGMWPYCESVQAAKSWGAVHHNCKVDFRELKQKLETKFPQQLNIVGESTPNITGYFEVELEGGKLIHSKKNGDGYVDTNEKLKKIFIQIEDALKLKK